MAVMTTTLTEYADLGNSRKYTYDGHTAAKPKYALQKRREATGNKTVMEDTLSVIALTEDADGAFLPSPIVMEARVSRPKDGISADLSAALVVFRDFVASDEFGDMISTQNFVA